MLTYTYHKRAWRAESNAYVEWDTQDPTGNYPSGGTLEPANGVILYKASTENLKQAIIETWSELSSVTNPALNSIQLRCHTTAEDGGGGIFDIVDNTSETYVADGGTVAIAGTRAIVRRDRLVGPVRAEWWGVGKADDTEAFTRALAFSVGVTYDSWVAGGGDTTWYDDHETRPVEHTRPITLTSTITIRYRGVQIHGPCQYGDGLGTSANSLIVRHNDHGIRIDTGDSVDSEFHPSLSLRGVNITRHEDNRVTSLDGIYIDGIHWFRGLTVEDSNIRCHRSGIGLSAAYAAAFNIASGLTVNRSGITNNREYGINTGTTVQWDLSNITDSGLNHNSIGPMRMVIAGGNIDRIDIEGGGNGGYIIARNARLGNFYTELTGPETGPAITFQAVNSIIDPGTTADGRSANYLLRYSRGCTIKDKLPVRMHGVSQTDAQSGWSPTDLETDLAFMVAHCPERAPYLRQSTAIVGAVGATTYTDPAQHTTTRNFNGFELPAAEIGVSGTPLNARTFNVPYTIEAGKTYVITYCAQYAQPVSNFYSHVSYVGIVGDDIAEVSSIAAGGCYQHVLMFTAAANASSVAIVIWPYSTGTTDTGFGAAISPFYMAELPASVTNVDQFHAPTLIYGTTAIGKVPYLDRTGVIDVTTQLQAAINSLRPWETLKLGPGTYRITRPITLPNLPNGGYRILGEGGRDQNTGTTKILATFAVPSGTAATITGTTTHNPAKDTRAVVVTLSGLTGISAVEPGDTLWISNATLERNNGAFTIMSVDSGAGTITYFGYNNFVHTVDWRYTPTEVGETNNGSLHWQIRKPMFKAYTRNVAFESLHLDGAETVGAVVDSTITGSAGTPTTTVVNSANKFDRCFITRGIFGIKIGDFSGYATGGCTEISWVNNCDLHVINECMIRNHLHSCIYVPNATSNSMLHSVSNTSLQYAQMGICSRKASFQGFNVNFTGNSGSDVYLGFIAEPWTLRGGSSEESPRFLVLGFAGYMAGSDGSYPFLVDGFRCGPNNLPADKCYIQSSQIGGLTISNCNFNSSPGDFTIGVYGYGPYENPRQVALKIENCIFPCATPATIVTSKAGAAGHFPVWYYSLGNTVQQDILNRPMQCPNGIIAAYGNPANSPQAPVFQILQLATPSYGITSIINGENNAVTNPFRTCVNATGPTAAVTLNGITTGEPGQRLELQLSYNQVTTINHLSSSAAAGNRIVTTSAGAIHIPAPGTSSYALVNLVYSATADSGSGAWVVQSVYSSANQEARVDNVAALRALRANPRLVYVTRYSAAGTEAGGGWFEHIPGNTTLADDNGIILVNAIGGRYRRQGTETGPINVAWYGIFGDTTTDHTVALQALFTALPVGRELYIPRGRYRITDTLHVRNAPQGGFKFRGDGCIDPNPSVDSTTLWAIFETQSGTAATLSSIVPHNPALDPYSRVATLTGLTGIENAKPGDTLRISNAATEDNNGFFTIMSVDAVAGSLTYLGFNVLAHTNSYISIPTLPDANNGSFHWEIRKPMVTTYTRDVAFDSIFFQGNDTCGACVDSTWPGEGGVPGNTTVNTNIRFTNCRMAHGFTGVKIGDFSGFATGGCTEVTWAGGSDFHFFEKCSIVSMDYAAIYIPNATSNSMQHTIRDTSLQYCQYGIAIRKGSFIGYNLNFTSNTGSDILIADISEPSMVWGGGSEHSARFLVIGTSGYRTASTVPQSFTAIGVRTGSSNEELPADRCFIQTNSLGSVTFKNCHFFYGNEMTFGAQGYTGYPNNRQVAMTFEGCSFSCATPNDIVTAMPGPFNHKVWFSCLSCTTRNGFDVPVQVPNGILEAKGPAGATDVSFPLYQIGQLGTPSIGITSIVNGVNNAVPNPFRTSVTVTGPTAAVTINGITAGENGQRLELQLGYNQATTINHLSASASNGTRILTNTASTLYWPAPGANNYVVLYLQYSLTEDSGNGAWVITDIHGIGIQDIAVGTIAELRALPFNPTLIYVTRYSTAGTEAGGGWFELVAGDSTSTDNNGTLFVNAAGGRYIRQGSQTGPINVRWFGAALDWNPTAQTGTDDTLALIRALEYANGLAIDAIATGTTGDTTFASTGRICRPVLVDGPLRKTATIVLRYRGIQIIGTNEGSDGYTGRNSCIIEDHAGHGFWLDTGTTTNFAPSFALIGCDLTRATAHTSSGLDGVYIDGTNWFMGLKVQRARVSRHRNGLNISAAYKGAFGYASKLVLTDGCYFEANREYGINLPVFWDISEVKGISCWQNTLGGILCGIRGGSIESIDLEGQPGDNQVMVRQGRSGQFYLEQVTPETSAAIRLVGCYDALILGSISVSATRRFSYSLMSSSNINIVDQLPVRPLNLVTNVNSLKGYYPPQIVADGVSSIGHVVEESPYLAGLSDQDSTRLSNVVTLTAGTIFTSNAHFAGYWLPAAPVGTVGSPIAAVSIGNIPRTFTEGHIYMIAFAITYDHVPSTNTCSFRLVCDEAQGTQTIYADCVYAINQIVKGNTVQIQMWFVASRTTTIAKLYVWPYANASATPTDYGAFVSEVFTAEVASTTAVPQINVPKLLAKRSDQSIQVTALANLRTLTSNPARVYVTRHSAAGTEAGSGWFEYLPSDTTAVDDDGTLIVNAIGGRYRRQGSLLKKKDVAWWGIVPGIDVTTRLNAVLAASTYGDVLVFARGRYTISSTIDIENRGITLEGQGCLDPNPYIDSGAILISNLPTFAGTAATISSVVASTDTDARIVTYTGLTGITNVAPGDTLRVYGAALNQNNGYFPIINVDSGAGSVTCYVYNQFVTLDGQVHPVIAGETNNGSLSWQIRKTLLRIHRDTKFESIFFNGAEKTGVLVESGYKGTGGIPGVGAYDGCTSNKFRDCKFRSSWTGLSIGGISNYLSGGCTDVTWAPTCDLHSLFDVRFTSMPHCGLSLPSTSGTSVMHDLQYLGITECGIGIASRKGSFKASNLTFSINVHTDILLQSIMDPVLISGGHSEGTPRFLVLGRYGYHSSVNVAIPVQIDNYRTDANVALPADGCYIQMGSLGGVSFKSCLFQNNASNANWTIGVQGSVIGGHERSNWILFDSCGFTTSNKEQIVTALAGTGTLAPVYYTTQGCYNLPLPPAAYHPERIVDGVHRAYGNPAGSAAPETQVLSLVTPPSAITLSNGVNNSVTNPWCTSVTATGPTAAVTLNGIAAGLPGQVLELRLAYNQATTINHLSASASAGARIATNTASAIYWPAPGANTYVLVTLQYDSTADAGSGAWVVKDLFGGKSLLGVEFQAATSSYVALSTNSSTSVLACTLSGLEASTSYSCTLGVRTTIWNASTASVSGAIDETVDLYITTDASRVATVTVQGTQYPDISRLPSGLAGATMTVTATTGGFTIYATRPTDVACRAKAKCWISSFETLEVA